MAFLTPDSTYTAKIGSDTITVKVKITPDGARATKNICDYVKKGDLVKPNAKLNNGTGKPKGITVHNTNNITVASGTNPAEQYARATYPNGNMNGVAVHYWVYKNEIWQQLADNERGWHAADGSSRRSSQRAGETIGGNLDTIAIECIETGTDATTEDTLAKLVAYLLDKHGLSPDTDIYTHNYFYSKKYCPVYILPHWDAFKATVKKYYNAIQSSKTPTPAPEQKPTPSSTDIKAGDLVKIASGATYYSGKAIPSWVASQNWYVKSIKGNRAVIDKNESGSNSICSPVNVKYLSVVKSSAGTAPATPTPAPEQKPVIKVGSTVRLKNGAKTYTGGGLAKFVYERNHVVKEIKGDRVVITYGGVVVAAVKLEDLTLVS